MTDKQIIEPCMGCSALECWGVVDCDVAQRVLALYKTLTEIKTDILDIREGISYFWVIDKCNEILQKISECEGNDEI